MFKGLTQRAQKVLTILSQEEAKRFHSNQLLPEHIILALLKDGEGVAVKALLRLKVSLPEMQTYMEESLPKSKRGLILGDVPPSKRGQKILEDSAEVARDTGKEYIGTEHLFLAAVHEVGSPVSRFLYKRDIHLSSIREAIKYVTDYGDMSEDRTRSISVKVGSVSFRARTTEIKDAERPAKQPEENTGQDATLAPPAETKPGWRDFEDRVREVFTLLGYEVTANTMVSGAQTDLMADSVSRLKPSLIIECKYHDSPHSHVSINEVENFIARVVTLRSSGRIDKGYLVTNTGFTSNARGSLQDSTARSFVFLCTYDSLFHQIFDVEFYLKDYIRSYEGSGECARYVDLWTIDRRLEGEAPKGKNAHLDGILQMEHTLSVRWSDSLGAARQDSFRTRMRGAKKQPEPNPIPTLLLETVEDVLGGLEELSLERLRKTSCHLSQ